MNKDDVIRIAREAGLYVGTNLSGVQLVGSSYVPDDVLVHLAVEELERFAALVVAAEREACAKVCEERSIITPEWQLDQHYNQAVRHCAAAIRARGQK